MSALATWFATSPFGRGLTRALGLLAAAALLARHSTGAARSGGDPGDDLEWLSDRAGRRRRALRRD